jgi:hypothetical protein
VAPDMIASTPAKERQQILAMLERRRVALPLASQLQLVSCEASAAREAAELSMDWSTLISMVQPWGASGNAFDPFNPRAADIDGPEAAVKWQWFQKIIVEESLVEYLVQGENLQQSAVALAKQLVSFLESSLDHLTDEFYVKKVDVTLSVARAIVPLTRPSVEDIAKLHADALALKGATQSKGTSVRVCVATAIMGCPWWLEKLEQFVGANAIAARYVEEIESATAAMHRFEATGADAVTAHMGMVSEQSRKLCFYQSELLEGSVDVFATSLLTSAVRVFNFVEKSIADKAEEAPSLLRELSQMLAELSNCFPEDPKVNSMVDTVAERLATASQGEAFAMMQSALEGLQAAGVPTEGNILEPECATFAVAYKSWVQQPCAKEGSNLVEPLVSAYQHVATCLLETMAVDRVGALLQCGSALQGLLEEHGKSHGEVHVIKAALAVQGKLGDFAGKEVSIIIGEGAAFDRGVEIVREFQQAQQQLLAMIKKSEPAGLKEVLAKGSEIAKLADEQIGKFEQHLVSGCLASLAKESEETKAAAPGSRDGDAWHSGLGARAAWPKVQEQGVKYFADFDEQAFSMKLAALGKASCGDGHPPVDPIGKASAENNSWQTVFGGSVVTARPLTPSFASTLDRRSCFKPGRFVWWQWKLHVPFHSVRHVALELAIVCAVPPNTPHLLHPFYHTLFLAASSAQLFAPPPPRPLKLTDPWWPASARQLRATPSIRQPLSSTRAG